MDDIASQILHGCKLAGELETNLPNLLNQSQHNLLIDSCDQIVQTFSKAIRQLTTSKEDRSSGHGFIENEEEKTDDVVCAGVGATIGREEDPLAPAEKQMGSPDTSESVEMIKPHRIGPGSGIRRAEEPSTDAAVMLIGTSGESSIGAASMTSNKMKKRLAFTPNEMGRNVKDLLLRVRKQMDELGDDGYNWRKYGVTIDAVKEIVVRKSECKDSRRILLHLKSSIMAPTLAGAPSAYPATILPLILSTTRKTNPNLFQSS
ncbi:WRKY domain-containing protein [Dioscorea alata]|uniref:WRKY domain-containing protein n=1 Tax=Dioscorea alata TaxID=55571 RepID=A0ACB7U761_DIOAL|nr:WRKY domain-containing protein [Dioscorea alata]